MPVIFSFDYYLKDLASTNFFRTPTIITINPDYIDRLARVDSSAALFVLAHECGHASLLTTNETAADCWAASIGVVQNWLAPGDLPNIRKLLFDVDPGDATHPPGEERAARIVQCVGAALAGAPLVPL